MGSNKRKIIYYFIGLIFLLLIPCLTARAESIGTSSIKIYGSPKAYINDTLVWDPSNNVNISAAINYSSGMNIKFFVELYDFRENIMVGNYIKLTYTTCIYPTNFYWMGVSDSSNASGDFRYYKTTKPKEVGTCSTRGQTGKSITGSVIFVISNSEAVDANSHISQGYITVWGGSTLNSTGYATIDAISFSIYDPTNDNDYDTQLDNISSGISGTNEKLDSVNSSINETNDTLKDSDSSGATDSAGSFFSGFTTDTFGLTSIITAPINLIKSITSSTCSPMGVPVPFVDTTMNLPCLSSIYRSYFGSFLDIYQTITFGIVGYWVCVRIFALVKDFKNPEHDEIEVLDL